ncbi:hypothetical protein ACOSQ4_023770 [Xanthoceras sorbifolium]
MASAVLVSPNEPSWKEPRVFMRKHTNTVSTAAAAVSNDNALLKANPHRNPNPYKQSHACHQSTNLHVKDTPSTDTGLSKRKPVTLNEVQQPARAGHVTFNLGAYTRRQLKDLKRRLLSELQQVRVLRARIESTNFEARSIYPPPPPPPPIQVTHATDPQQPSRNRTPKSKKKGRGSKRANPFGNSRQNPKRIAMGLSTEKVSGMMRRCRQILGKLMKYKHGWVFNAPVDVVALGLHDYNEIIKTPMDLGTVKSNLDRNVYKSPLDFASDVRLTFNNALKYNPKGHDVHSMAETLLAKFEGMFNPVFGTIEENSENVSYVPAKGREVKKREMSNQEKKTLEKSLLDLPQEKTVDLLDILKKRNDGLFGDGDDEIVLNVEVLDDETLWELDRFVCNYRKMLNKIKKQEVIEAATVAAIEKVSGCKEEAEEEAVQWSKKGEVGEEDVDIGEEIPVEYYPPVEIERDVNAAHSDTSSSNSSSSGSDTSSSSGSDSATSSDDTDNAQSKHVHET